MYEKYVACGGYRKPVIIEAASSFMPAMTYEIVQSYLNMADAGA